MGMVVTRFEVFLVALDPTQGYEIQNSQFTIHNSQFKKIHNSAIPNMQIIKEFKKVSDRRIIIDLPDNFYAKEVEIIVIPYKKGRVDDKKPVEKRFLIHF
jgi:hypothetical protein